MYFESDIHPLMWRRRMTSVLQLNDKQIFLSFLLLLIYLLWELIARRNSKDTKFSYGPVVGANCLLEHTRASTPSPPLLRSLALYPLPSTPSLLPPSSYPLSIPLFHPPPSPSPPVPSILIPRHNGDADSRIFMRFLPRLTTLHRFLPFPFFFFCLVLT